jgi:copper(I)-binding protein
MRGVLVVLVLLLSGCGLTGRTVPAADAAEGSASVGTIRVSDAYVDAPPGGRYSAGAAATVEMLLSTTGEEADDLTAASSPAAANVELRAYDQRQERISVDSGPEGVQASCGLEDLTESLAPGQRISLTLRFSAAGSITVSVPVQ